MVEVERKKSAADEKVRKKDQSELRLMCPLCQHTAKHSRRVWVCLRDAAAAALQGNASSVGSKHSVRFSSFIQSVLWFGVVCHDRGTSIIIAIKSAQSKICEECGHCYWWW